MAGKDWPGEGITILLIDALVYKDGRTYGDKIKATACPACHVMFLLPELPAHNCVTPKR